MSELFEPNRSGEAFVGYVHLLLSLYFPPGDGEPNVPTDGSFKADFLRWISTEFVCGSSFSSFAVELVSTLQMESDCDNDVDWTSSPPAIIWNAPTASINVGEQESYATWNVTYPVYDWGDSMNLQQDLQEELEHQITNGELDTPWQGAAISVIGAEQATFGLPVLININSIGSNGTGTDGTFSKTTSGEGLLSVDAVAATTVQYIGGILLVLHTILVLLSFMFGSSYKEKARKTRADKSLLDAKGLDDMLLLTKDHNLARKSTPELELETPYTASAIPVKQVTSPTRSFVSNLSIISSANYIGESLFPPMFSDLEDDEESEAGTEVIVGSVCSASDHSVSDAVLGIIGSVCSGSDPSIASVVLGLEGRANKSILSGNDDGSISKSKDASTGSRQNLAAPFSDNDDRSTSKGSVASAGSKRSVASAGSKRSVASAGSRRSVASAGSRRSFAVPGTILGNPDDDDDSVSDTMLFD